MLCCCPSVSLSVDGLVGPSSFLHFLGSTSIEMKFGIQIDLSLYQSQV